MAGKTGGSRVAAAPRHRLAALDCLRMLDATSLRGDVVAGATLAACLLPAALGEIVGGDPAQFGAQAAATALLVDELAGADMLLHLRGELQRRGIRLVPADARGPVLDSQRAAGLEAHFGPIVANASIASVLAARTA